MNEGKPASPFTPGSSPAGDAGIDAEETLWTGGYSAKAMYGSWLGALVLSVVAIVAVFVLPLEPSVAWMGLAALLVILWGGLGLLLAYRKLAAHYELTNQRFIHKSGVL